MSKEFSLKKNCIALLILIATFKSSSSSCLIVDKGEIKQKTSQERVCPYVDTYGWDRRRETQCHYVDQIREVYVGPTTFHCSAISFEELNEFNAKTDTKNHFYVNESSLNTLVIDKKTWPGLTEITLENVNISKIVPGFFNGFTDLTMLSIPHNNITDLVDGIFSALTNLVHLNLSHNVISNLEPMALIGLPKLNTLDLHHNKILTLPPKFLIFQSNLTYLDLSDNLLNRIDEIHLHNISINNNNMSVFTFPNNTASKLQVIDISNNIITEIEYFEQFKGERVDMSFNLIEKIDRVGEVDYVNLSHNHLRSICTNFIPDEVKVLDLSFNFIDNITKDAFDKAFNLTVLNLNDNKLKELSIGTFKNQEYLKRLDLSNNNILYFEFGLFNDLKNLKFLNISSNEGILDFQTLFRLSGLEELDFQKNKAQNFDDFFFETHQKLKIIRMGYSTWNCGELAKVIFLMESRNITVLEGSSQNEVHINGINCDSDLKSIDNKNTIDNLVDKEVSNNEKFVNVSSDLQYIENLNNVSKMLVKFGSLTASLQYREEKWLRNSFVINNVNFIICNLLLLLILCSIVFIFLYLKRNFQHAREQVELI